MTEDDRPTQTKPETRELVASVGGRRIAWDVVGPFDAGSPTIALDEDEDLTAGTPWHRDGYVVTDWLDATGRSQLEEGITEVVRDHLVTVGADPPREFRIDEYHRIADDAVHARFTGANRCFFPLERIPLDVGSLEEVVSARVGRPVQLMRAPVPEPSFLIRIVRPGSQDHSPPHRDHWLEHLRSSIAGYLPVAGSSPLSSLALAPGSHRWAEDAVERTRDHGVADGVQYGLPVVSASREPLDMVRPSVAEGQLMVFSPYLVHGAAANLQRDLTRVSLELRFR